ncbi:MAG: hypothetical protein ACE5QF_04690 [Thermoplasmata archaeon]
MIIPEHCREVGVKEVDFPLTSENIMEAWKGKRIYFRTKFLVLRKGDDCCVLSVESKPLGVLNDIQSIEIVSLPKETIWVEDSEADVLSPTMMVRAALSYPGKTVIVSGAFDHVSFVKDPGFNRIRVFDVVPPHPSKLVALVERVADSHDITVPLEIVEEILDLNDLAKEVGTDEIMLPCEGELATKKKVLHLSRSPDIRDATLVGCEYSKKIARELYGRDLPFIQICPKRIVGESDLPTIVKCCELQSGYEIDGNLAVVPWGARTEDVTKAIRHLLGGRSDG